MNTVILQFQKTGRPRLLYREKTKKITVFHIAASTAAKDKKNGGESRRRPLISPFSSAIIKKNYRKGRFSVENFIFITELIGTGAFAVSGAIVSIRKGLDIFGVIFCGIITALGGGVIRDVILSNLPPVMFCTYIYAVLAVLFAVATFLFARRYQTVFLNKGEYIDNINNFFDAVGLGSFTIIGIQTGLAMGYGDNAFFVLFLGMTTGCGGGILRDILVREIPFVLSKRIYAIASLLGGIIYYLMFVVFGIDEFIAVICGVAAVFFTRVLSSRFHWNLPKALSPKDGDQ